VRGLGNGVRKRGVAGGTALRINVKRSLRFKIMFIEDSDR